MVIEEFDMLQDLITRLEDALLKNDIDSLYELIDEANALYGNEISGIKDAVEDVEQYHNLVVRKSKTICHLLKQFQIREKNTFRAGIMPITNKNLGNCPKAQKVYRSGTQKYMSGEFDRNVLDDMRLSLELLVKQILSNDKSLENQLDELGRFLKESGSSTEMRNLIRTVIDGLCRYQNNNVKHNDKVNPKELEYVIEQTSAIINYLVLL